MRAASQSYVKGHEYVIDENGTTGVWNGKGFVSADDYLKSRGQSQTQFDDKRAHMERIQRAKGKVNAWSTGLVGGLTENLPGSPARSLASDLAPLRTNEFISGTLELRQNSPTGAGVGNQSDAEGRRFEGRNMSFDIGQPGTDMRYGLNKLEESYGRHTPGLTQANPYTLTEGNRDEVPQGAYFRAGDGQIYRNQRGAGYKPRKPSPPARGGAPTYRYDANGNRIK